MIKRAWPYGTRKRVRIVDVTRGHDWVMGHVAAVLCEDLEVPGEAFLCLLDGTGLVAIKPQPEKGQERAIEFRAGGPTGGYWHILDAADERLAAAH